MKSGRQRLAHHNFAALSLTITYLIIKPEHHDKVLNATLFSATNNAMSLKEKDWYRVLC